MLNFLKQTSKDDFESLAECLWIMANLCIDHKVAKLIINELDGINLAKDLF